MLNIFKSKRRREYEDKALELRMALHRGEIRRCIYVFHMNRLNKQYGIRDQALIDEEEELWIDVIEKKPKKKV